MYFTYQGRDAGGNTVRGIIAAENQELAVRELRRRNIFVIECRPAVDKKNWEQRRLLRRRVSRRDLALFCRQLATMLGAGLPIITALQIIEKQVENRTLKTATAQILSDLASGEAFYRALEKQSRTFPPIFIHTIEAGEMGGALDETLEHLAIHLEREHEVEEKVKSAMAYPLVVCGVAVLVVVFLLTYVLPTFQTMLNTLQVPLPWPTRLILGVSQGVRRWWPAVGAGLGGAGYGFYLWYKKPQNRLLLDKALLRLPVFGSLHHKAVMSRFSRTLGTLLHSGVALLPALEVVRRTAGNSVVARALERAEESVRDGQGLAAPLDASGVFPPMVVEMITVGEETGALEQLLFKLSTFFDREVEETVTRLSSLVEPLLILVMGGIVGLVVVAVLLPVFSLVGGVR